ncbi:MAG: PadR family transcriptional regulator [Leifsonia sp.]
MSMRHAILGLLDLSPLTGYDVKRHFDATIGHFWTGDQAQIYRTLDRIVADGLADVEVVEQSTRPNRRLHRITAAGRAELDAWLRAPLEDSPVRDAFLARVFFAGRLDEKAAAALFAERRIAVLTKLDALDALRRSEPDPRDRAGRLRLATLANGISHLRTELAWLDETEEALA